MIRVLALIAVTGFLVSIVTLSTAVAIGGPEALSDGAWGRWGPWASGNWASGNWAADGNRFGHHGFRWDGETGPRATRELAWTGGETLEVDVPADITYTQAPGPGKLIVTGSRRAVDALELRNGTLTFSGRHRHWGDLTIVMTAPAVRRFNLRGSGDLAIIDYRQDSLSLDLSGSTDVSAKGEARAVDLVVSGSADTDLSGLKVNDAQVRISGSGGATLAPTGKARLEISGSGDITLLTHPASLDSNISGSGAIHQRDEGDAPQAPAPPAKPGRKL